MPEAFIHRAASVQLTPMLLLHMEASSYNRLCKELGRACVVHDTQSSQWERVLVPTSFIWCARLLSLVLKLWEEGAQAKRKMKRKSTSCAQTTGTLAEKKLLRGKTFFLFSSIEATCRLANVSEWLGCEWMSRGVHSERVCVCLVRVWVGFHARVLCECNLMWFWGNRLCMCT